MLISPLYESSCRVRDAELVLIAVLRLAIVLLAKLVMPYLLYLSPVPEMYPFTWLDEPVLNLELTALFRGYRLQVIEVVDEDVMSQLLPSTLTLIYEALVEKPEPLMESCCPLSAPLLGVRL